MIVSRPTTAHLFCLVLISVHDSEVLLGMQLI